MAPRYCSWDEGDYLQIESSCDFSLKKIISFNISSTGVASGCIQNPWHPLPGQIDVDCDGLLMPSRLASFGIALAAIGMSATIITFILVAVFRRNKVIKKAQPPFLLLATAGAFLMNLTILAYIGANTSESCLLRPWAFNLSASIMYLPSLMKLHRVDILFDMSQRLKRVKISDLEVARNVFAFLLVDIILLLIWTFVQRPEAVSVSYMDIKSQQPISSNVCINSDPGTPMEVAMLIWKCILAAAGIYKAIRVWDHPSDIAEVKHFMLSMYLISVVGCTLYFMSAYGAASAPSAAIMRCIALFVCATFSNLVLVVPKFITMYRKGNKNDRHNGFESSGHNSGSQNSERSVSSFKSVRSDQSFSRYKPGSSNSKRSGPASMIVVQAVDGDNSDKNALSTENHQEGFGAKLGLGVSCPQEESKQEKPLDSMA
jgi:7 transmembrane sweet-taste receptor of 3 GCPR